MAILAVVGCTRVRGAWRKFSAFGAVFPLGGRRYRKLKAQEGFAYQGLPNLSRSFPEQTRKLVDQALELSELPRQGPRSSPEIYRQCRKIQVWSENSRMWHKHSRKQFGNSRTKPEREVCRMAQEFLAQASELSNLAREFGNLWADGVQF